MTKIPWLRRVPLFVTSATMVGFGFAGMASAQTITNTGPHSRNTIDTTVHNNCVVKNDNDVVVNNTNYQTGNTGDATVGGNTGRTPWSNWSNSGKFKDGAGGNTTAGDATSGDVWNTNSSKLAVAIDNSDSAGVCLPSAMMHVNKQRPVQMASSHAPGSVNRATAPTSGSGAGPAAAPVSSPSTAPVSGPSAATVSTSSVVPVVSSVAVPAASISNTGPRSSNEISQEVSNKTSVTNTNNLTINNTNYQTGSTGDAAVAGNTTAGDATSGSVKNANSTWVDVVVTN